MLNDNSKNTVYPSPLEKGDGLRPNEGKVFRVTFAWQRIPPLVRVPLLYGLLGGLVCIGFIILFYYMGKHPLLIPPFFDVRVLIIAILLFFAIKEVRDYFFGGIIFLWQGMGGCLVFLASLAATSALGMALFGALEPGFVKLYIDQGIQQIKNIPATSIEQIGKQAVEEVLKTLPTTTLGDLIQKYTGQTFAIGFFITIIISVILRRQPKPL
jgi:hypothetical protein